VRFAHSPRRQPGRIGRGVTGLAVLTTALGIVVLTTVAIAWGEPAADEAGQQGWVPIECGGYDARGDLVEPDAPPVDRAPIGPDGRPQIPDVCGGYTQDGTYVGDD
jgi:hypothetical protein